MSKFEKRGFISIWAGLTCDNLDKDILRDLCGVDYYDVDWQENVIAEDWKLTPIHNLLARLSFSKSFLDAATAAAEKLGIAEARQVVSQLNFKYDPKKVTKPINSDPDFVGAFKWSR